MISPSGAVSPSDWWHMYFKKALFILLFFNALFCNFEHMEDTVHGGRIIGLDSKSGFGVTTGLCNGIFYDEEFVNSIALSYRVFTTIGKYYPFLKGLYTDIEISYFSRIKDGLYHVSCLNYFSLDIGFMIRISNSGVMKYIFPYIALGVGYTRNWFAVQIAHPEKDILLGFNSLDGILDMLSETSYSNLYLYTHDFYYRCRLGWEFFFLKDRMSASLGVFFFPMELHAYNSYVSTWKVIYGGEIAFHFYIFTKKED
ncbi:hypothetical protein ACFL6D_01720 [Spirochaetota bacterium]